MIQTQSLDPTPSNYYQNIQHSQTFQHSFFGNGGGGIHNQQQVWIGEGWGKGV